MTASRITIAQVPGGEFHVTRNEVFDGDTTDQRLLAASENLE